MLPWDSAAHGALPAPGCPPRAHRPTHHTHPRAPPTHHHLRSYCKRIVQPTFWGGEVELLVLSQMLKVPIFVYVTAKEANRCDQPRCLPRPPGPAAPGACPLPRCHRRIGHSGGSPPGGHPRVRRVGSIARRAGGGYVSIQRYGEKYTKPDAAWKKRSPVRLLYTGGAHYDLLLKR